MKASPVGTIFYKPEEVGEILGIPRAAVMRAINRGELEAVRLSRSTYRVMDHQLADYQHMLQVIDSYAGED